ncbi:MAG TPA: hypothetical protein VET23_11110, partial [Chitinophagaceae bacterium]|nr:hypothetical protein [Chitinophagaceae bacterium]
MLPSLLPFLVCPVSRTELTPAIFSRKMKSYNGTEKEIIWEGILYADKDWFYPIIEGIPRLQVEAFLDNEKFFLGKMPGYEMKKKVLLDNYSDLLKQVIKKNKRSRQSFELEWSLFD